MSDFARSMKRIAELLPAQDRERFLAMATRLKNAPEDDEFLMVIEAMGFMTLLWQEVPNKVREVITSASDTNDIESNAFLASELKAVVVEAINVPTYTDMRELAGKWEEQHGMFKSSIGRLTAKLENISSSEGASNTHGFVWGVAVGISVTLITTSFFPEFSACFR